MAHLQLNKWQLSRRHLLRGLGTSIALPWLEAMASNTVTAPPKRSVFLYIPNGVNPLTWQIQQAGAGYEFTAPLKALERHRADITPISGLHHPNALGKHHNCDKVWLTGADVPSDGGIFRNSISADQLIAEAQRGDTRLPSLQMAIEGHSLAWSREGHRLPALRDPQMIFDQLFGKQAGPQSSYRGSVLDRVSDDTKRMFQRLGKKDQSRLDDYLTAVREVEVRATRTPDHQLFFDLLVLALRTDSTRVITCMIGSESHSSAVPEHGVMHNRHTLSHHHHDPLMMEQLTLADAFLIRQFSYFLDQLKTHKEHELPLLDSTQILWGSGMSYGHGHGNANLPIILAGGRALGYKHGTHVDFNLPNIGSYNLAYTEGHYRLCTRPIDSEARLSNLLLTMIQRVGVNAASFQDSVSVVKQVLA